MDRPSVPAPSTASTSGAPSSPGNGLTRKSLLQRGVGGVVGASALGVLLSACGDNGSSHGGSTGGGAAATSFKPDITARFDPKLPAGSKPALPRRFGYVAFSSDPFWVTFSNAVGRGCKEVNLELSVANAQGDAAKYVDLLSQQLTRRVGGTFVFALAPTALDPILADAISSGVEVVTYSLGPSISQVAANEVVFGKQIGEAAAKYINDRLGGKASVLLFNEDKAEALKPRYQAIRDALRAQAPKATIVKDLTPANTADDGFKQASSALAANPEINAIIGPGLATVGAFSALESTGKARPEMYIASIGGTQDELNAIQKPNSAFKTSWGYPDLLVGYLSAHWTSDWLDGKVVPMGLYNPPLEVTVANVAKFQTDMKHPENVFKENRVDEYLQLWGSINYDTRDAHLAGAWHGPQA
ncbi:MAG TPA: sugar ABC transporter substrate-binding protein [Conexibacter sp.]|jgi:ribose transport system substrate-binding protein|nr:sugar ABC transporter substrate-binding protein [Conexibacter sp.]